MHSIEMRNTTIAKNVAFVKWFLRWTFGKGYYTGNLHLTWKPKFKGTDGNQKEVIFLSWNELMRLYNYEVPESKQYLERVRDVFCFTCFTSLRYSDVAKLSRSDVKPTHISIVTQKTTDSLKIELNKYSLAILDKYKDVPFPNNKVLPVISNVRMNIYLKELGQLAGLNDPQRIVYFKGSQRVEEVYPKYELLTTHCGRRTFIVNSLYLGIPAEVIMRWTGHSDFKAMKPYVKIVDELKEQEMNKFNEK
jgi:integrase